MRTEYEIICLSINKIRGEMSSLISEIVADKMHPNKIFMLVIPFIER